MFKSMLQMKQKFAQSSKTLLRDTPRRMFSSNFQPSPSYGAYALLGAGTAGLAYLMYQGHSLSRRTNL
jgi:hypothetical protein